MGRNWAIAIGINTYDNLQPLNYAHRDAAAIRDYFLDEVGFEKVYYFTEDAPDGGKLATHDSASFEEQAG